MSFTCNDGGKDCPAQCNTGEQLISGGCRTTSIKANLQNAYITLDLGNSLPAYVCDYSIGAEIYAQAICLKK